MANEIQVLLHDESHVVLAELARAGGSPGGVRPKVVAFFNPETGLMSTHEGLVPGAQPWLFKFPAKEDPPDSCAMEELYARMSGRCGLGMEPTRFMQMPNGLTSFGTRRFDRDIAGQRIHVHSFSSVLHANFRLPSLGYVELMQATRRLTRDKREIIKALQRCVFNVAMNNRDDHSKNFCFMLNAQNEWVLSPPYDLTYATGLRGEHFMDVGGEGKAPTREHVLKVARAGGLKDSEAGKVIDTILGQLTVDAFRQEAANLPVRISTVDAVARAIEANRARLEK
jgi:serine/threonine-protein kinase HipA